MTLTEFLLARIAEDEAAARKLRGQRHRTDRALAECEAKRRIIQQADLKSPGDRGYGLAQWTLRWLAMPHVGHRDWIKEWRPA